MAARKTFLLRVDPALWQELERWAADDLRSVNGQVEFVLREALRRRGRPTPPYGEGGAAGEAGSGGAEAAVEGAGATRSTK